MKLYTKQGQLFHTTTIKDTERAKLRQLRDEIARDNEGKKRRAEALRRAEREEATWELYRTKCVPLRGLR